MPVPAKSAAARRPSPQDKPPRRERLGRPSGAPQPQPLPAPEPAPGRPEANGSVPWLVVRGAAHNNLKNIDISFPLGRFVCVTGVSGSGKSSLVNDILFEALARDLNNASTAQPGRYARIDGVRHLDKVIAIDQTPIGRTPRSNPGTYIKVFDEIRDLFAKLPDAKLRGYAPGRFSFNVSAGRRGGGRCEACEGNGSNRIEMDFLADVWVTCPICEGRRFSRETQQIQYKGKSIADVLEMDVADALALFENVPRVRAMLQTLHDVGLDYIKIGQPSTTLSGGEAQRIKLARELVKKPTGRTLYVLDEPTTGLHFEDVRKLLAVLHGFVDAGNTVVVIEHNLDVIKTADWLIDLGPEGGERGGWIVAEGTPEDVAACDTSYTGIALRAVLNGFASPEAAGSLSPAKRTAAGGAGGPGVRRHEAITVRGARQHNLRDLDVSFPREQITVCTGVSGSGKTSFAIDTVFSEGYRRYVESLSAYARQFLGQLAKPKVEHVEGLSPAICIEQKAASKSPRSTVGTITEIYDYMRVLWARVGTPHCPDCHGLIGSQSVDEIVDRVMGLPESTPVILLAPVALGDGESWGGLFNRLKSSGYQRVRIDGQIQLTAQAPAIDARRRHRVEVVIDRTVVRPKSRGRVTESIEHALSMGNGVMVLVVEPVETVEPGDGNGAPGGPAPVVSGPAAPAEMMFSQRFACTGCGRSFSEIGPNQFSFNSQLGWCETCEGLGVQRGAPAAAIIRHPQLTLFNGALDGWASVDRGSPLGRMIEQLCERIGVDPDAPLKKWKPAQIQTLLYGTEGEPLEAEGVFGMAGEKLSPAWWRGHRRTPSAKSRSATGATPLRFHWRGLFPTIDAATRNSWSLRTRLSNVVTDIPCVACRGGRLRPVAAAVRLGNRRPDAHGPGDAGGGTAPGATIVEICNLPLSEAAEFFAQLDLLPEQRKIAGELLHEIRGRLQFLIDVGLGYLTLHRAAPTLSGGEAQRIRLASQIGSGLSGVLYVLDEPTIGLHPRDNLRLIRALIKLRELGNTLLLVEHDRDVIRHADRLLDFGPGAGAYGGRIVAQGTPDELRQPVEAPSAGAMDHDTLSSAASETRPFDAEADDPEIGPAAAGESLTRGYLSGTTAVPVPTNRRPVRPEEWTVVAESSRKRAAQTVARPAGDVADEGDARRGEPLSYWLRIRGARHNNLKQIDVPVPLQRLVAITGVSGSGKSSLIHDILWPALANRFHFASQPVGSHDEIEFFIGPERIVTTKRGGSTALPIDKVVNVDQSPIGANPSSNPATYTGVFEWVRELFARLPDAKMRGYTANRFSFNRGGGRCEACEGMGQRCIQMHFMPDVWVECEACRGQRYEPETLAVKFHGHSISDVLNLSVTAALELFRNVPRIRRMLQTLVDVGLDYVQLGQSAPTLSGGEAQRVKLAAELGKPDSGRTLYILDEPTTGLHFEDVRRLLNVLNRLVDIGNSVIVVEHNLDVLKSADWIIDLGPEAGEQGGRLVAAGTPEEVAAAALRHADYASIAASSLPLGFDAANGPARPAASAVGAGGMTPVSHTGLALAPVLAAGPRAVREVFDAAAHQEREIAADRAGLGRVGRETRPPWIVNGRKWHLEQRRSRNGRPVQWETQALLHVIELAEGLGDFRTNWNQRACVEVIGRQEARWFLHALTGGEWLLELYFLVPRGSFKADELNRRLKLKTLDERDDIQAYGSWPRVDVRERQEGVDAVAVYIHDREEIDTPAFRTFVTEAARLYWKKHALF